MEKIDNAGSGNTEMRSLGIKKINKVKPTPMQLSSFENIKRGMKLRDAMIAGGYTKKTATHPKQNLINSPGFQVLIQEYREDLKRAGVTKEVLAEIQAEGLFDADANIRLDYLRENKKDLGLVLEKGEGGNTVNVLVIPSELMEKYAITSSAENSSSR